MEVRLGESTRARSTVDLATVPYPDYVNEEYGVQDLIQDPVISNPHPIHRVLSLYRHARRRPRAIGQQVESSTDPLLLTPLQ